MRWSRNKGMLYTYVTINIFKGPFKDMH